LSGCLALAALVASAGAAAAQPQFVTLERVDREARIGIQAALLAFDKFTDIFGLRGELYAQLATPLREGGVIGGYGHVAASLLVDDRTADPAVSNVELGGYYIGRVLEIIDLALHLGLGLPTASDDFEGIIANVLTSIERNYNVANGAPSTTVLNLGVTLRAPLGATSFLQADLAMDVPVRRRASDSFIFHANLGIGTWVSDRVVVMGELATAFGKGDLLGSVCAGIRFLNPLHPHIAYILVFADEKSDLAHDGGIIAHVVSVGIYLSF
jgi:hypothetical protein